MKKRIVVSIVAPVYNVAPYLSNFIDSVIGQTYTEWELLLVDDGSTDESGIICDNYALKDERIKVIHKSNGGVGSARNAGLKEMKGEWVIMPDPDDELPLDSLETLINNVSNEIDLVSASYVLYKNGELMIPSKQSVDMELSRDEFVSLMGIIPQPRNLDRRCCNKLFRASIIKENGIYFPEDLHFREEVLYNYLFLNKVGRKVRCISYNTYIYYRRESGTAISNQMSYTSKSGGLFIAMTRCYDILEQMNAPGETKVRMRDELFDTFRAVIRLIDRSGVAGREKRVYTKTLSQYFSKKDLCRLVFKRLFQRFKRRVFK